MAFFDLNTMKEQDNIMQCPYCYEDLTIDNSVGETGYDVVRIGHNIGGMATVFECPKCFEKSFIHKESLKWKI
jgi:hypothetical protein